MRTLKAEQIKATEISEVMAEIESNHLEFAQAVSGELGWAIQDAIEAIAAQIVTTGEDYVLEDAE